MKSYRIPLVLSLPFLAQSAWADQVFTEDLIIQRNICVGEADCIDGEVFGPTDILIKGTLPEIQFEDTNVGENTWTLSVDDIDSGVDAGFSLKNETTDDYPIAVHSAATHHSLWVGINGNIGMGTSFPLTALQITGAIPEIRLEDTIASSDALWGMQATHLGFVVNNREINTAPFSIGSTAPSHALHVGSHGNIGIGTFFPSAPLELSSDDTFNFFRITAEGSAVNESVDITFTGGPLGTGQLRYNIVEVGDSPQVPEMTLDADGNMVLTGTLTTTGPTCSGGCDRVFDADYPIPSITDHADQMFSLGHLPSVGPILQGQPVNVSERMGEMLNALEHAHIYIAQQQELISDQQAKMTQVMARLEALEIQ